MSVPKGKNAIPKASEPVEQPVPARVVAIPKNPEAAANKSERIGDILRRARLERDDDLHHIAEYLCIKSAFLVALENSRYDELPADAYVIGFLRTYATFLGVNGKDAVDRYRYEMAGRRKKPILSMPVPMSEGPAPSGIIMVGATLVVLLIYALWYGLSSSSRTAINAPPPLPAASQQLSTSSTTAAVENSAAAGLTAPMTSKDTAVSSSTSASSTNSTPTAAPSATVPPAAPGIMVTGELPQPSQGLKADTTLKDNMDNAPTAASKDAKDISKDQKDGKQIYGDANSASRIIIRATQSSWVMITDDSGKAIFDHVLKTGDVYKVPNKRGLSLTTGNGNGIILSLDGVDLPKVATGAPHVVRNITLDPDQLSTTPVTQ